MPSVKKPAGREARPRKTTSTRGAAAKKSGKGAGAKSSPVAEAAEVPVATSPVASSEAGVHRAPERPKKTQGKTITIVQYVSGIACPVRQKRVLRSLGLRHPHHRVVRPDNPAVRGMVLTIPHLVRIVEDERGA